MAGLSWFALIGDSEIFNRDNFDNLSEEGKAFMEPVLKELDNDRLSEVWENHCSSPTVADEKKLMNIGRNLRDFITQGETLIIYSSKKITSKYLLCMIN